ncbi:Synaptonemal Complex Protein 1 [Manis pentadactyla]|nr:Synaptonemal Complex Protein 1 [Manis pentadactyla]
MIGSFEERNSWREREMQCSFEREKGTEREREMLGSFDRKQRDTKEGGMIGSFEERREIYDKLFDRKRKKRKRDSERGIRGSLEIERVRERIYAPRERGKREMLGSCERESSFEERNSWREREMQCSFEREKGTEREREMLGSYDRKQRDTKEGGMIGSFEERREIYDKLYNRKRKKRKRDSERGIRGSLEIERREIYDKLFERKRKKETEREKLGSFDGD